ncbi:phosphoribosylanthranilate isomerase [Halocalculus aciditolerans]|uniref:N-(5'-phosphoribosyl)anthranilate isomerase n=1 Tax=Halocalculus aciditolerans TaxID=1383812 RepID=A0A830F328_9EURY|nr:phosphoribosylanthranilate isomerase [Halocalculus aciditolerans]GGL50468.1 N-(5'-phosphoribosyl)anthranilate isomerase [Halocalculus aciditolerans]
MTRAKVCGLTREADVDAAVDAGADALGFLVDVPVDSPREIPVERAAELAARVPPFVTTVLVTMQETPGRALGLAADAGVDAIQLHGGLGVGDLAYVKANFDGALLAAVDAANPEEAARVAGVVDAVLLDSLDAAGAGGTGETADWPATADVARDLDVPVLLAGGLTPDNVAEAVGVVAPYGVDVASGVEARGGEKDNDAVRRFVRNAEHGDAEVVTP